MSAFLVMSDDLSRLLVTWQPSASRRTLQAAGETIRAANVANLRFLYQDRFPLDEEVFVFDPDARPLDRIAAIQLTGSVKYQCSDCPEWDDSPARQLLRRIMLDVGKQPA